MSIIWAHRNSGSLYMIYGPGPCPGRYLGTVKRQELQAPAEFDESQASSLVAMASYCTPLNRKLIRIQVLNAVLCRGIVSLGRKQRKRCLRRRLGIAVDISHSRWNRLEGVVRVSEPDRKARRIKWCSRKDTKGRRIVWVPGYYTIGSGVSRSAGAPDLEAPGVLGEGPTISGSGIWMSS